MPDATARPTRRPAGDEPPAEPGADREGNRDGRVAPVLLFPSVARPTRSRDLTSTDGTPTPRLRDVIGDVLRDERLDQGRTLADVASRAAVSLPYLSEVERGAKEVSSDVLAAICDALRGFGSMGS